MPTFKSFEAYASEVDRLDRSIDRAARDDITRKMAEAGEKASLQMARRDLGGDTRFSGWRGRDLADMNIKRLRGRQGHILTPTRKSGGPWKVAEQGRNAVNSALGGITNRRGLAMFQGPNIARVDTRKRSAGESTLRFSSKGNAIYGSQAKGKRWSGYTAGKGTASDALLIMDREAPKIAERETRKVTRKHFDVD